MTSAVDTQRNTGSRWAVIMRFTTALSVPVSSAPTPVKHQTTHTATYYRSGPTSIYKRVEFRAWRW